MNLPSRNRLTAAAIALVVVAASVALPGNRLGLGVLIVGISFALLISTFQVERNAWHWAFLASGLSLLATAAVRDAYWLVLPACGLGAGCLVFAALHPDRVSGLVRAFLTFFRLIEGSRSAGEVVAASVPDDAATRAKPLMRGLAIGLPLVGFFGALLASADRAFAHLAGEVMLVDVDVTLIPARIALGGWAFAVSGALYLKTSPAVATWSEDPWTVFGPRSSSDASPSVRSSVEWVVPLAFLNLLFAAFVAVQFAVLFGGRAYVLRTTGLGYAQYARSGFFQLLVVAGLILLVIAGARRWVLPASAGEHRVLKFLLSLLAVSSLVILASAMYRLGLYENVYGPSRARFGARLIMFWVAALLLIAIVRSFVTSGAWAIRLGVVAAAVIVVFGLATNPDAQIAEYSVERFEATGEIDALYVSSLSADAVPQLLRLPEDVAACVLDPHLALLVARDSWGGWNLGRSEARAALAQDAPESSSTFPCSGLVYPR